MSLRISIALLGAAACLAAPLAPSDVLVEYMRRPTVETPNPRFYWLPSTTSIQDRAVTQTAYQIIVTNTLGGPVMWDSGKVASAVSAHIPCA